MSDKDGPGSAAPLSPGWLGKIFLSVVAFGDFPRQALFASVLPEILELLGQQSKWAGAYHGTKGKRCQCLSASLLLSLHPQSSL